MSILSTLFGREDESERASAYSDLRPGDTIAYLNEDDEEHPYVDTGVVLTTYPACSTAYDELIPLRHAVQPSDPDAGPYIVQHRDILDCQEASEPEEDARPWWKLW